MINRRAFLAGSGGFFAFALQHRVGQQLLGATPTGKAKRCLVLWMEGGPSQLETFDPKPGTNNGGPTKATSTASAGLHFAGNLPELAKRADELAVLRNVSAIEGEHFRATYHLHTGFRHVPGFPRPSLGSVVSYKSNPSRVPQNVTLGGQGFGPAFLGLEHSPFSIESTDAALEMLRRLKARRKRLDLIQQLGSEFDANHSQASSQQRTAMISQMRDLVDTPFIDALNTSSETASMRDRYGTGQFAKNCLVARRMLEAGVSFVEVRHGGWDTHTDNFAATSRLCEEIDKPFASLLKDLKSRGLLDETLVVWMGEFGRTPTVNADRGRDHFPQVTAVVLAGAGIDGGGAIGETSKDGSVIDGKKHSVADVFATIFHRLGISNQTEFTTDFDSPTTITDDGEPIEALAS